MGKRGGARPGAGRKPKAEEIKIIEEFRKVMPDEKVIRLLASLVEKRNLKAIEIWLSYLYGKPKQMIDANITNDVSQVIIERKIINTSDES